MDSKEPDDVDSRDNPFLPGGNLSKEAEDILSRATIIRDTFILQDNNSGNTGSNANDTHCDERAPVEEQVTAKAVGETQAAPTPNTTATPTSDSNDRKPKENGQLESETLLTPVNEKVELDKNKKKPQKCCAVM